MRLDPVALALPSAIVLRAEELGVGLPELARRMGVSELETVWLMSSDNLTVPVLAQFAEVLDTTPTALAEAAQLHVDPLATKHRQNGLETGL